MLRERGQKRRDEKEIGRKGEGGKGRTGRTGKEEKEVSNELRCVLKKRMKNDDCAIETKNNFEKEKGESREKRKKKEGKLLKERKQQVRKK